MRSRTLVVICSAALGIVAAAPALGADEGAKVFGEVCTTCHTPKVRPLDDKRLTKVQWGEAVKRMKGYGADVPNDKMPQLLDYLERTHGPGKK